MLNRADWRKRDVVNLIEKYKNQATFIIELT